MVLAERGVEAIMPFNNGDFVLVEYTLYLRRKNKEEVIDTTDEEIAKKHGIYSEKERYGPRLVIIGEGRVLPGLEETIRDMSEGEEREVEIPPEKAYGEYDPRKVQPVFISQLVRIGIRNVRKGDVIRIGDNYAYVSDIRGRRVILDFNHPLAGKTVWAKVRIVKKLEEPEEKVKYLLLRRTPPEVKASDIKVERKNGTLVVEVSPNVTKVKNYPAIKAVIIQEVEKYLGEGAIEKIVFIEEYPIREKEKKEKEEEETKSSIKGEGEERT